MPKKKLRRDNVHGIGFTWIWIFTLTSNGQVYWQNFMTSFEGDVAKIGKSMFFSDSCLYHFEVILSKFFGSSDSEEIFDETSA